jgi:hypothetical protein
MSTGAMELVRSSAERVGRLVPGRLAAPLRRPYRTLANAMRLREATFEADCPICGYHGRFSAAGVPLRPNAQCRRCSSMERHRQLYLLLGRDAGLLDGAAVLHFAPEECLRELVAARASTYVPAHYDDTPASIDIRDLPFADDSFDLVVCAHVLEHVDDDHRALTELRRVLRPDGTALVMVPFVATWPATFEDPTITDPVQRERYFGQYDHVRYYGADVEDRFARVGFTSRREVATEPDVHRFALDRGSIIFVLTP